MIFNSKLVVAASMAMSTLLATAQPVHVHNMHKRDNAVTVTVVVDGNGAATTPNVAPAAAVVSAAAPAAAVVSAPAAPAAAPASSSSPSSGGSGAGAKGIVYSPYKVGACKTADEVKADIAALSGYDVIRIYGVDCDQVTNVLAAIAPHQKIFFGIFDVNAIESGLKTIADGVANHGGWDIVHTISIGNELVNNGQATVDQIAGYLSTARSVLKGLGYTGPVVSVDTFIAVINNPGLCALSDYVAINAHAFFDGNIKAEETGKWVLGQIQRVWSACNEHGVQKNVFVTESGWPSKGDTNGVAVPSKENQQAAVSSIKSVVGDSCILFTAFNDYWKADGPHNAEKYWGVYSNE